MVTEETPSLPESQLHGSGAATVPAAGRPALAWQAAREVLTTLGPALVIAVLINALVVQSSVVYGQSMAPNLEQEQRLLIEKLSYRLHAPERGDIVILRNACDGGSIPLVKRVVGLGGEQVRVADGRVYIDGAPLPEPYENQATPGQSRTWQVPPGYVFVMGDNRGNSCDSRVFGPVPLDSIYGHAILRYWPLSEAGRLAK